MENYEQKYKETLGQAKQAIESIPDKSLANWLRNIFPELKESEDERIRKEIIAYLDVQEVLAQGKDGDFKEWIAWLEKQGKKTIPKNIDDAALQYVDTCAVDGEVTHGNIIEPYWNNHSMMNAYKAGWFEKQGEKKGAITPKEAWKDMRFEVYAQASGNRHEVNVSDDSTKMFSLNDIDEIFEKIEDTVVEQKPACSEEDNKIAKELIRYLPYCDDISKDTKKRWISWLKLIKPQQNQYDKGYNDGYSAVKYNLWKPSKEQMKALEDFVRSIVESRYASPYNNNIKLIYSLLNDLKSL